MPKKFEEYMQQGIIKKCSADVHRAEFLISESGKTFKALKKRLKVMGIDSDSANSIVRDCYNILMEVIRARMLVKGFNASGLSAHEAEVSYLKKLGFLDNDVLFMNNMRYLRNGMLYYGTIVEKEYAEKAVKFLEKVYWKLRKGF